MTYNSKSKAIASNVLSARSNLPIKMAAWPSVRALHGDTRAAIKLHQAVISRNADFIAIVLSHSCRVEIAYNIMAVVWHGSDAYDVYKYGRQRIYQTTSSISHTKRVMWLAS